MKNTDELAVKTIRMLSAEAVEKAKSGHPGLPLGAAPMAYTLWSKHLKHNPANSKWKDRDRFVLSAGHGSMLLYSLLHIFGYDVTVDDIKDFRQAGSRTPGHPEYMDTDGVETTTGPLGQGFANAVGMALAEKYLSEIFNTAEYNVMDHYTYVLAGDGCMMEGITSEASSIAGTLGLEKLIVFYDSNQITIEGSTDLAFREDVAKRYEAYGWEVISVPDGHDIEKIDQALIKAKQSKGKPVLIIAETIIGYGSPEKQGTASAHGEPLGQEQLEEVRKFYQWEYPPFTVPQEVIEKRQDWKAEGIRREADWQKMFEAYKNKYPALAESFEQWFSNEPADPDLLFNDKEFWNFEKDMATREASGICIERLLKVIPNMIGGSADLAPSNKTYMTGRGDFSPENYSGANLRFGVREHAMAAMANGVVLHGGLRIFVGTFFTFTDYMKAAMRLSALMQLPVTYILTHDSIGLGEDGPTHQPVEHLAALRSMPGLTTFRPADPVETAAAWFYCITEAKEPVAMILSRQKLPRLNASGKEALKGAYVIKDPVDKEPEAIIMATGSEVHLALEAADELENRGTGVRVVSFPSFELFEKQQEAYKKEVFPPHITKRIAVEAAVSFGWHKYTGADGGFVTLERFGASGKSEDLFLYFGITKDKIINKTLELIKI